MAIKLHCASYYARSGYFFRDYGLTGSKSKDLLTNFESVFKVYSRVYGARSEEK